MRTMSFKIPLSSSLGSSLLEIGGYDMNEEKVILKKPRPLVDIQQSYKTSDYQDFLSGTRSKTPAPFNFTISTNQVGNLLFLEHFNIVESRI